MRMKILTSTVVLSSSLLVASTNALVPQKKRPLAEGLMETTVQREVDVRSLWSIVPQEGHLIQLSNATVLSKKDAKRIKEIRSSKSSDMDDLIVVVENENDRRMALGDRIGMLLGKDSILLIRQRDDVTTYIGLAHADRVYKDFLSSQIGKEFGRAIDSVMRLETSAAKVQVVTGIDPELFLEMVERFEQRRVDIGYELTTKARKDGSVFFIFDFTMKGPR